MQSKAAFAAVLLIAAAGPAWAGVTVDKPRCEYQVDPRGIDVAQPRLSWILQSDQRGQKQTAYQVLVASSPDVLAKDQGDLWDSRRVASDQTIHVEYAGKPLSSRLQCFWKVRAWDQGRPGVGLEQTGPVDHGLAESVRLGCEMDCRFQSGRAAAGDAAQRLS